MLVKTIVLTARFIVGGIFLLAGFGKIKDRSNHFLNAIIGYGLLPKPFTTIVARWLPWFEVGIGGCLVLGVFTPLAALLSSLLLLVFAGAITISLLQGKTHSCGCSQSLTPIRWWLVYRNLGLIGLSLFVMYLKGGLWSMDNLLAFHGLSFLTENSFAVTLRFVWVIAIGLAILLHYYQSTQKRKKPADDSSHTANIERTS